jgi:quercetin dioxygenase-like cupin family protein
MNNSSTVLWVLGHKIRPLDTDDSYGLIEVTSPPHVSGPPPHYHKSENEFFLVIKGTLDVMSNGEWRKYSAGSFVDLPPNTVHTFINNTEEAVVWITGWRPKGFERFFRDFGISVHESKAQERSVTDDLIQKVVLSVERYGMYMAD